MLFIVRFVLKELIQTEKDYVKSLGEVVEVRISDVRLNKIQWCLIYDTESQW